MRKFKYYSQAQTLLPFGLDADIPEDHLVRVVNSVVEEIDLSKLCDRYSETGCPAYHPQMMLKVLIFAYTQKTFTSRKIAAALRENICFRWLAGGQEPDFRTINRFRLTMKDEIAGIFNSVVRLLIARGHVGMKNYFVDGTKIGSAAGKYTWVWKKSTVKYDEKLDAKIRGLMKEIDRLNDEEDAEYGDADLDSVEIGKRLTADDVKKLAKEINEKLAKDPQDKDLKEAAKVVERDYLPRKEKYDGYFGTFDGRNSFSKTDHDATFMRMKEDHMGNGQLKPAYNVQIGTEDNFIVGYTIHPNPTDTKTLIPHLKALEENIGALPETVVSDAGYGSEENYEFMDAHGIRACVKYNRFHVEQKRKHKEDLYHVDDLEYDAEKDEFICPIGRRMKHVHTAAYTTDAGYETTREHYRCESCEGCALAAKCKKSSDDRTIRVSHRLRELKRRARELLLSEEGVELRGRRSSEVEQTFGRLKGCWGFRRFFLRGMQKVKIEWGLLSIAHNITKLARKMFGSAPAF